MTCRLVILVFGATSPANLPSRVLPELFEPRRDLANSFAVAAHHVRPSRTSQEARPRGPNWVRNHHLMMYRNDDFMTPCLATWVADTACADLSGADDKKLQQTLKKLNTQPIQAIEEVNMFKSDGNVIHFAAPKVHAAVPANTFAIYGNGEDKELTELVPGILNQLGPDSLASLRKLAESYQNMQKGEKGDDDEIPDLVEGENFESKVE
ncbi:hypothetical protein CDD82_72 [Ophiocordyceps australis]|uniref:Nascent polypeptide-associated complex subunit beta n=2 Tax=Ophiocordyceps australis TaxID=1399860 RepID=A0A2C5ZQM9_9HYPO|nr:hypothetical protein CDD82_72 [Ophiocordyceps australis]